MELYRFVDIYATKGIEYLIVILFFVCLCVFATYMFKPLYRKIKVRWIK
jgi:hypothetical protein